MVRQLASLGTMLGRGLAVILVREERDLVWDIRMGLLMLVTDLSRHELVLRNDVLLAILLCYAVLL